jgi:hypothetical protein
MVTALQGQQDPTMDALFQQPPPALTRQMLFEKGREMLKDPNRPQYNPNNVDRPMVPGEQGSPFQGILNPRGWGVMTQQHPQHLQHMAGDVVPGPGIWGSHISMPEPFRPRREGGVAGMLKMDPSHVDPSNVVMWPHGIPANQSPPWDE